MADSGTRTFEVGGLTLTIGRTVPPQLQALHNEDILMQIFSFLDPLALSGDSVCEVDPSTREALLFLCLTCRFFVKPAADLLWRKMTSLTPLFKILPTFVNVDNEYVFTGVIRPEDMERFRMYARKIKRLAIRKPQEKIAIHCILRLSSIYNLQPILPALKDVHLAAPLTSGVIENCSPLFLIHGNVLSRIKIVKIDSRNESFISSFLIHLSERTPTIQQIVLAGHLSHQIYGFLKSFRRLQHVDLAFGHSSSPITASLLQDLGDLPDLRFLGLGIEIETLDIDGMASIIREGTTGFQALNTLEIDGLPTSLQKLLQCIPEAPALRRIECHADTSTSVSIQGLITEMCRVGRNMKSFTLLTSGLIKGSMIAPSSTNSLSPLIHCRQLSSLDISDVVLPINLDDSISFLSENGAWQNMQTLELRPPPHVAYFAGSLTTLRILAQNCPVLIKVTIPIDFTLHSPSSLQKECQHPRTPHHPLKQLFILQQVHMKNHNDNPFFSTHLAGRVARFLRHYFPNLVGEMCQLETSDTGDLSWWNVVRVVMEQLSSILA